MTLNSSRATHDGQLSLLCESQLAFFMNNQDPNRTVVGILQTQQ